MEVYEMPEWVRQMIDIYGAKKGAASAHAFAVEHGQDWDRMAVGMIETAWLDRHCQEGRDFHSRLATTYNNEKARLFKIEQEQKRIKETTGFAAMGKPIPSDRLVKAEKHIREMGVVGRTEEVDAMLCQMAEALARDKPAEARDIGLKSGLLDFTGVCRVFSVLCCG